MHPVEAPLKPLVKDPNSTAFELAKIAAEQGDAKAQYDFGVLHDYGRGVQQDFTEAAKWYRKAANQGYAEAQNSIGDMYLRGEGVPKDYAEAVKWFKLAAVKGHDLAQTNLGYMYASGFGLPHDNAEAAKWYNKAALQGNADAQYALGILYEDGAGVSQDNAEAVKWYQLAAKQGLAAAQTKLKDLNAKIAKQKILEVQKNEVIAGKPDLNNESVSESNSATKPAPKDTSTDMNENADTPTGSSNLLAAATNDTERAFTLGADRSANEELKDTGGIRDRFYGLDVLSVVLSYTDSGKLKSVAMIINPNTPPKNIRNSLDKACGFSDANWEFSNNYGQAKGNSTQQGISCRYLCDVGSECDVIISADIARQRSLAVGEISNTSPVAQNKPQEEVTKRLGGIMPDLSESNIEKFCAEEWTRRGQLNTEMFEFCSKLQLDGWNEVKNLLEQYQSQPWIPSLSAYSLDKWTERGVINYQMYGYTIKKEIEGYLDIEYLKKEGSVTADKIKICETKWLKPESPQFSMVFYCLKKK